MSGLMDNDSNDIDLDESVDGTVSAPDFVTPPNGVYRLQVKSVKVSTKPDKDKPEIKKSRASVVISIVKTIDAGDEIGVPDGSLFSMNYQWTEQGKGFLKSFAEKVLGVEACKNASWKQIFTELETGMQFDARIRVKKTTNDKGDDFENVNLNDIKPATD